MNSSGSSSTAAGDTMADKVLPVLDKVCVRCLKICLEKPMQCADCGVGQYCERECQLAHWENHKPRCVSIKNLRREVAVRERALREEWDQQQWEDNLGKFCCFERGRKYCDALTFLAVGLANLRNNVDTYMGQPEGLLCIREAEKVFEKLAKLCRDSSHGYRLWYPIVLLTLNKVEEAFEAVAWWAIFGDECADHGKEWKKGEQLVGTTHDVLDDVLDDFRVVEKSFHVHSLMYLMIMKVWLIKRLESGNRIPKDFSPTYPWSVEECIKVQVAMLTKYCALMEHHNPYVFESIISPASFEKVKKKKRVRRKDLVEQAARIKHTMNSVLMKYGAVEKIKEVLYSKAFDAYFKPETA